MSVMFAEAVSGESVDGLVVPPEEQATVEAVVKSVDRYFSPEAAMRGPSDKEVHGVIFRDHIGEIVKYQQDGSIVRSLEVPLAGADAHEHLSMAFSIRELPDGSMHAGKHLFAWWVSPSGERNIVPLEPEHSLDRGDYDYLVRVARHVVPRRLSKVLF